MTGSCSLGTMQPRGITYELSYSAEFLVVTYRKLKWVLGHASWKESGKLNY